MSVDWIPAPAPEQNPIPKRRADHFLEALVQSRHAGAERTAERDYTPTQVYQTAAYGQEYPNNQGRADVSIFKLNSIDTPGTRRRIVVNKSHPPTIITVLPREPIAEPASTQRRQGPSGTKKAKKAQLAKKRARSSGNQP